MTGRLDLSGDASQRMLWLGLAWLQVMSATEGRCGLCACCARGACGAAILGSFPPFTPPALARPAGRKREPTALCGRVVEVNEFMRRMKLDLSGRERRQLASGC
jgi:hypothetical protein